MNINTVWVVMNMNVSRMSANETMRVSLRLNLCRNMKSKMGMIIAANRLVVPRKRKATAKEVAIVKDACVSLKVRVLRFVMDF